MSDIEFNEQGLSDLFAEVSANISAIGIDVICPHCNSEVHVFSLTTHCPICEKEFEVTSPPLEVN